MIENDSLRRLICFCGLWSEIAERRGKVKREKVTLEYLFPFSTFYASFSSRHIFGVNLVNFRKSDVKWL
jgi:hypothetical protein